MRILSAETVITERFTICRSKIIGFHLSLAGGEGKMKVKNYMKNN